MIDIINAVSFICLNKLIKEVFEIIYANGKQMRAQDIVERAGQINQKSKNVQDNLGRAIDNNDLEGIVQGLISTAESRYPNDTDKQHLKAREYVMKKYQEYFLELSNCIKKRQKNAQAGVVLKDRSERREKEARNRVNRYKAILYANKHKFATRDIENDDNAQTKVVDNMIAEAE